VHAVDGVTFDVGAGETLGWSASRDAANRPPALHLRLIEPTSGRSVVRGRQCHRPRRTALRASRATCRSSFRIVCVAHPRMTVGGSRRGTDHSQLTSSKRESRTASIECWRRWAWTPTTCGVIRTSFQAPAPAHRHRARACGVAQTGRLRRGGFRARCVDSGEVINLLEDLQRFAQPYLRLHRA